MLISVLDARAKTLLQKKAVLNKRCILEAERKASFDAAFFLQKCIRPNIHYNAQQVSFKLNYAVPLLEILRTQGLTSLYNIPLSFGLIIALKRHYVLYTEKYVYKVYIDLIWS